MPKKPAYTLHKPTGQARVRIDGRDHYLGPHGSPQSKLRYDDLIADWLAKREDPIGLTIDDLCLQYLAYARQHYRKDGIETSEANCVAQATRPLIRLFGPTLARSFGPKSLKRVRDAMIQAGLKRTSINLHVGRIRRMFKWAVSEELLPVTIYQALKTVAGLEAGRSAAKESEPVQPVSQEAIEAIRPFVSRQVWGMIQVQLASAMRPGEVTQMRACDLNMSGKVWSYTPSTHKTSHHGKKRVIYLGGRAQKIIKQFVKPDLQAHLFDPREAKAEFIANKYRAGSRVASQGRRFPKYRYTIDSYATAVRRACERAFEMPDHLRKIDKKLSDADRQELKRQAAEWRRQFCWHPHQLRHTAATTIRREFGIELARLALGHSSVATAEIYAEADYEKVKQAMAVIG